MCIYACCLLDNRLCPVRTSVLQFQLRLRPVPLRNLVAMSLMVALDVRHVMTLVMTCRLGKGPEKSDIS